MNEPKAKIVSIKEEMNTGQRMADTLENLVANMGTAGDKRAGSRIRNTKRLSAKGNEEELIDMYRTDWVSGKVVDIIPSDMTREWRSFKGEDAPELIDILVAEEERLDLAGNFKLAHMWARLLGTSFIVMDIDDGQTPDKPLKIDQIRPGGLRHIKVVDKQMINPRELKPIANPLDPNYGFPEMYSFNDTNVRIHHSRVLRFDGVRIPFRQFRENNYFSDSVLDRLYDSIINFLITTEGAASMVFETNTDVVKVKGLMSYLTTTQGEETIRKRFALAKLLKSFNNMMLLDAEEGFEKHTQTFAGLPDLIDRYAKLLAAATDIPATRFLGTSASGLNATGEGDLKNYYDLIASLQVSVYKPKLDYFDQIMRASLQLEVPEDMDLKYEFNSLFQLTPEQQATIDLNNAQRDQIYMTNDVITASTVAKELKQNGTYSNITDEMIDELEEYEDYEDDDLVTNTSENPDGSESENEEGEEETDEGSEDSEEL